MAWKKGQSGNPKGRQKGIRSEAEKLRQAVKKVEKERGIDFYQHFCERALEDNHILIALMKKLIPDMKQIEQDVELTHHKGLPERMDEAQKRVRRLNGQREKNADNSENRLPFRNPNESYDQ